MSRRRKAPARDPLRAVAYLRVSTEDQRLGPEAQRDAIAKWAAHAKVEIVAEFVDHGVSGAAEVDDRPHLPSAIDALSELNAGILVATKRDRFARDVVVAATIESMVARAGARVMTADGVSAENTPEAALMRTLMDAFAAYERALIRSRTRAALRAKRARGERAGSIPFGFELDPADPKAQRIRPSALEQRALAEMRRLRAEGLTQQAVADELNRRRLACRGQRWTQSGLSKVLARAHEYAGSGGADYGKTA